MMKTKQDNDAIDRTMPSYTKNDIELLWLIGSGAECEKTK